MKPERNTGVPGRGYKSATTPHHLHHKHPAQIRLLTPPTTPNPTPPLTIDPTAVPQIATFNHAEMESLIKAQEDACVLPTFDSNVAFALGTIIRTRCQRNHTRPAVVYIAHAHSSHLLFFAASHPGTHPDDMHWVRRKEAVVLRWRMSTMRVCMELESNTPAHVASRIKHEITDPTMYAFHGGGFPVRVKNVEGIVGVIVVNGLNEKDDHGVIVDGIQEYLANIAK